MGLPKKPENIVKPRIERRSAPVYLMNIYSKTVNKINANYTSYDPTNYDYHKVNQSDTSISYIAQHHTEKKVIRRMWFDVFLNHTQELSSADLRLYRDNSQKLDRYQGLPFNITVYRVFINDSIYKTKYIYANSQIVEADYQGWIVTNITSCFQWWMDNPALNNGLKIVTMPVYDNQSDGSGPSSSHRVKPEAIGIAGFYGEPDKFAFAVGYYKDSNTGSTTCRDCSPVMSLRYKRSFYSDELNDKEKQVVKDRAERCQLRDLYIDFKEIGYQDWVIAPNGIDARDCIGKCEYPLDSSMNATVHGQLKSLMKINRFSSISPLCAPIKYSASSVLFWLAEDKAAHKIIKEVSASMCGCR
ncbi:bone morphogenetic protein 7-like [Microplitis mediator]|uniref:bone morphogenetic protein 7-like n=1 Tax=Microplitis mediator TaxID=375433 RepID=UPI0025577316|nr:bone morphogenetic protein 7-like [Microplitis mediator]